LSFKAQCTAKKSAQLAQLRIPVELVAGWKTRVITQGSENLIGLFLQ